MRRMTAVQEERGIVSLLSCILISLLLVTITLSVLSVEAVQLRKSVDAEQSLRAYYVAEAGIEDAAANVLNGTVTSNQGCQAGNPVFDAAGDANWTCQQIDFTGSPAGNLGGADIATTVNPATSSPDQFHSVIVEWQQSGDPNAADYAVGGGFPPSGSYTAAAPPLELSIVQYPSGGFAAGNPALTLENAVFLPAGNTANFTANYSSANFTNSSPYSAHCAPLGGTLPASIGGGATNYNCYAVLTNLDPTSNGYAYLFRIRSRYTSSSYKMIFKSGLLGDGSVVSVPSGTALLDVTAKAGTEYRRVISELPIGSGAAGGLNYVIYSDTNVCKDFKVINDVAQPPYPC
jgi:Tfp pilus assembly protein PilX